MSVKEFRAKGYLAELNRCFLHPLGLALEVILNDDDTEQFGDVWDYRDDPEGMNYAPGVLDEGDKENEERINRERSAKSIMRMSKLGYIVQPILFAKK